jgi:hypothetical protein
MRWMLCEEQIALKKQICFKMVSNVNTTHPGENKVVFLAVLGN